MTDLWPQLWRYGVTGVLNTALGLAVIVGLHTVVGVGLFLSNILGYAAGIALSFVLNRNWTFGHTGALSASALRFTLVVSVGFALSYTVLTALMALGQPYLAAQLAGVLTYSTFVFIGSRHVAFAPAA